MSNFTFELDDFAEEEFYNIVNYYKQLIAFPKAGNPYLHQTRRAILNRFPYAIVYKINHNEEVIVAHAVMHMKRKPDYWQERL